MYLFSDRGRCAAPQVPNASPTAASASSDMYGGAATDACRQLNDRLKPYREQMPGKPFAVRSPGSWTTAFCPPHAHAWPLGETEDVGRERKPHLNLCCAPLSSPSLLYSVVSLLQSQQAWGHRSAASVQTRRYAPINHRVPTCHA